MTLCVLTASLSVWLMSSCILLHSSYDFLFTILVWNSRSKTLFALRFGGYVLGSFGGDVMEAMGGDGKRLERSESVLELHRSPTGII